MAAAPLAPPVEELVDDAIDYDDLEDPELAKRLQAEDAALGISNPKA